MKGLLLSGSKLVAIPPDFVAQRVKLDLAKHFHVPLRRSYEPETSIFFLTGNRFYSPDRRPRDIGKSGMRSVSIANRRRFTYGRRNCQS